MALSAIDRAGDGPDGYAFGQMLVNSGRLTGPELERAVRASEESGEKIEDVVVHLGLVTERELTKAFSELLSIPIALDSDFPDRPVLPTVLSCRFLKSVRVIPLEERPDGIVLAVVNPLDSYGLKGVRFAVGRRTLIRVACPQDFEQAFSRLYGDPDAGDQVEETSSSNRISASDDLERLADTSSEAPVIRLVNQIIARAVEMRASDIHIEPMEGDLRIRYRVDGILEEVEAPSQSLTSAITSRIKVMARLNIAERRLPQDGRMKVGVRGKNIELRVSTSPTLHGESIALRILDRGGGPLDFGALGLEDELIERLETMLARPHGVLLVTGPTGCGKTTTLYAALLRLNSPERKILSIEDPIEYQLRGVNQVQVKPQIGLTFAAALRSFLRQDPDVMLIGEIRDLETAQIAIQAALTGHLILASLHTNDAASAITRLLDMGSQDYLLSSTINGIVAQRLVRVLCECRETHQPSPELLNRLKAPAEFTPPNVKLFRPGGCSRCSGTGYRGRTSIVEILSISPVIRRMILRRAEADELQKAAMAEGLQPMFFHGLKKAFAGITSVEEVLRVTQAA